MTATLSREHCRFLVLDEILGSTIVNFFLNGGIAWFLFRSTRSVPLWGWSSIAADTLVTAFVLPLMTSLITSRLVPVQIARGKLPPIPIADIPSSAWLPRSSFWRGAMLGIAAALLVATPVVIAFGFVGPAKLSTSSFIWFKATFAAGLGAIVTPFIGWWALSDASRRQR